MNQVFVFPDKGIERRRVATEQHADVAATRARRFVYKVVTTGRIRQFVVTSIKYAEIMVKAELPQRVDLRHVVRQDPVGIPMSPGRGHVLGCVA